MTATRTGARVLSARAALTASVASAVLSGAPAGAAEGGRRAELAAVREAVEQGVYLFARGPLERLVTDEGFERRDKATILLARVHFGLGEPGDAARLLEGYEVLFPESTSLHLEATYWHAVADLQIAAEAERGSPERGELLASAREGFQRILEESADPGLLAGARFRIGVALHMVGDFAGALEALRRAGQLGVAPVDEHALMHYFGLCNLGLRNFAEAARHFEGLVRTAPESPLVPQARYRLGDARYYLEEWEKAASAYAAAHEAAVVAGDGSLRARSLYALGWAQSKLGGRREREGDERGAEAAWTRAFESFDTLLADRAAPVRMRDSAAFEAAEALSRLGRYREAAARLLPLTDTDRHPELAAGALYSLGRCRAELGQLDAAIDSFERVLEMKQGVPPELDRRTRYALAEALVRRGSPAQARQRLEPLTAKGRLPSIRAEALLKAARTAGLAAEIAEREGRPGEAARFHAEAHDILHSITSDRAALAELSVDRVTYWLGRSAHDRARLAPDDVWFERAVAAYGAIEARGVHNIWLERALADTAELERKRGDLGEAARALAVLARLPALPGEQESSWREFNARLDLAEVELERGRPAAALEALSPVFARVRLSAGRERARYLAARARFALGRFEEARRGYESFLADHPQSELRPDALHGLGDCLRETARFGEAAERYEEVLAGFPEYGLLDRVGLAAGDARRDAGDIDAALTHYRRLAEEGRPAALRARAGLEQAKLVHAAGRHRRALEILDRVVRIAPAEPIVHEIAEQRGIVLSTLGRLEEAAQAFEDAAGSGDESLRVRARHEEAGALLALGRSSEAPRRAEFLRRAARGFTWVVYNPGREGPEGELKARRERAVFEAADALGELAAVEEAAGHAEVARKELQEARGLLELSEEEAKAAAHREDIDARLRSLREKGPGSTVRARPTTAGPQE